MRPPIFNDKFTSNYYYHYFDKNISITILYFYNLNKFTISNYQNKFYIYFY